MSELKTELLTLCDFALTSKEGKLSIIGIFDRIFVTKSPSKHSRFFIVAVLKGDPDSEYKISIGFHTPSGKKALPAKELTIKLGNNGKTNILTDVGNFPLNKTGEYELLIRSKGKKIGSTIFSVVKVSSASGTESQKLPN